MQIKVNGEALMLEMPMNVHGLAEKLQLNPSQVAIERNREIVPRSTYRDVQINEGDEIEIVRFIGGG